MTRRTALGILGAASAPNLLAKSLRRDERRYRADAVVTFLGMKIFSRAGVGSGHAFSEETQDPTSATHRIGFAGGSWPEKARGFNRLGFIQEHIVKRSTALHADYFGFMTSSPEEGFDQVKRASDDRRGAVPISAIQGLMASGRYKSTIARLNMERGLNWTTWQSHLPEIRKAVDNKSISRTTSQDTPAQPFLYTLSLAIRSKDPRAEHKFAYGEHIHTLTVEKTLDEKMGGKMKALNIVPDHRSVWRMAGLIRNPAKNSQTKFQLWYDADASPVPIRIELQARSFLRLVFEADSSIAALNFPELPALKVG
jgi:hypothetical protein